MKVMFICVWICWWRNWGGCCKWMVLILWRVLRLWIGVLRLGEFWWLVMVIGRLMVRILLLLLVFGYFFLMSWLVVEFWLSWVKDICWWWFFYVSYWKFWWFWRVIELWWFYCKVVIVLVWLWNLLVLIFGLDLCDWICFVREFLFIFMNLW